MPVAKKIPMRENTSGLLSYSNSLARIFTSSHSSHSSLSSNSSFSSCFASSEDETLSTVSNPLNSFECSLSILDKLVYIPNGSKKSLISGLVFLNINKPSQSIINKVKVDFIGINRLHYSSKKYNLVFRTDSKEFLLPSLISSNEKVDIFNEQQTYDFGFTIDSSTSPSIKLPTYSISYYIKITLLDSSFNTIHSITEPIEIIKSPSPYPSIHEFSNPLLNDPNYFSVNSPTQIQIDKHFAIQTFSTIPGLKFESIKIYLVQSIQKHFFSSSIKRSTKTETSRIVLKNIENQPLKNLTLNVSATPKKHPQFKINQSYNSEVTSSIISSDLHITSSRLSVQHKLKFSLMLSVPETEQQRKLPDGWLNRLYKTVGSNKLYYEFEHDVDVFAAPPAIQKELNHCTVGFSSLPDYRSNPDDEKNFNFWKDDKGDVFSFHGLPLYDEKQGQHL